MVAILTPGIPAALDNPRWQAMIDNDTRATGPFIIGVTTTGIYCVPGCPAKRPSRINVRFFDTPADARAAGLRACKRCHPDHALEH
jgi:AraC family transcriptional regulator of adaptative response/methylated-DNA-[protein]-cysteine methyltransferase